MDISRRRALALGGGAVLGAATTLTTSGPADATTGWHRLIVITANIGRTHKGQRERAIRDVRHAVSHNGQLDKPLVGWQEIREGDGDRLEPRYINRYFANAYQNAYVHHAYAHRVPMSIPREYTILKRRITKVHGGKSGVTPHRVITQALLERADTPGLRFVFANTHYVAGAWNGKHDSHEQWRRNMWQLHFRKHRDEVLTYWRARGYPVIWTGDVNRTSMPLLLPAEQRAFPHGLDQIAWTPGTNGTQILLKRTKTIPMHIDTHNARAAILHIRHT
ncbi:hypothetical protein [Streptomyces sp. NPDC058045]|uniref:hypothetical protein n=1 Tax=Streptomyces sp. NPDC058045 TaxID=3346311 RepID=UPI0036DFB816